LLEVPLFPLDRGPELSMSLEERLREL
jgi:hypothetical protein